MSDDTLRAAERWLAAGIAPIPVRARDKRPGGPWLEFQSRLPTYAELVGWFGEGELNLGLVCGWRGLTVLDFDTVMRYGLWLRWATRAGGLAAEIARHTYRVRTGRGMHLYLRSRLPQRTRPLAGFGIDVKGLGGYVLAPPSVHPSGERYAALQKAAPLLLSSTLSDVLPAEMLVQAAAASPPPGVVLPAAAPAADLASADPWAVAEHVVEFDRARGLERIKGAFRIEDHFPSRVKSSRDGRWWLSRCPFHDDTRPSFWIDTRRQLCGCHAGCTPQPLDVIDLYGRLCSISNDEAIRVLSRRLDGK